VSQIIAVLLAAWVILGVFAGWSAGQVVIAQTIAVPRPPTIPVLKVPTRRLVRYAAPVEMQRGR